MENTILNFNKHNVTGPNGELFTVNDFTNLYYKIDDKYYNNPKYYELYQVGDDEKIEVISYKQYGTPDRWDIILIMNQIHSPLSLPQSYGTVMERAELKYKQWELLYGHSKPSWFKELKLKYFTALANDENERFRNIKIIRKEYMLDFMYDLDDVIKSYQNLESE